jgi:hypothetical protein
MTRAIILRRSLSGWGMATVRDAALEFQQPRGVQCHFLAK